MSTACPSPGKIAPDVFARVIRPQLGYAHPAVRVGPQHGVDVGAINLGQGQVLAVTTDPLFVVPAYGWERAAWFALHIVASDAATSGLPPAFASVDLNLPLGMPDADLAAFWEAFHRASAAIGVAVVTGHTGRYEGCAYPILGGLTLFAVGPERDFVTPSLARVGDVVIVTKGPAIESVGQLGVMFPERVEAACGAEVARAAAALFWKMSVVEDARVAASVGVGDLGVTMMHDATEFGLQGALVEVAHAAGTGLVIDRDRIPIPAVVQSVCACFAMDSFSASSEGTLVATCRPRAAEAVRRRLEDAGIDAAIVGELVPPAEGVSQHAGGRSSPLTHPECDPFWPIFTRALAEGGKTLLAIPTP
ncbi:MAG: AIR synthase family protein [Lentisphaerae bacterium]|nr:AIR synthase family protein [Lentisphaerota bacterium]